jgi:hypothetical protein
LLRLKNIFQRLSLLPETIAGMRVMSPAASVWAARGVDIMQKLLAGALGAALAMLAPAAANAQHHQQERNTVRTVTRTTTTTRSNNSYGNWNNRWGNRPAAPPKVYRGRQNDWYRHVRTCQQRFRNYNPRTDSYVVRGRQTRRCTL